MSWIATTRVKDDELKELFIEKAKSMELSPSELLAKLIERIVKKNGDIQNNSKTC